MQKKECKNLSKKRKIKSKKKEELPSFLLGLNSRKEDKRDSKGIVRDGFLGPLFFGGCVQCHARPHSIELRAFHEVIFKVLSKEDILKNLFIPKVAPVEKKFKPIPYRLVKPPPKPPEDFHRHQCPGVQKVYIPEINPPCIDLGETTSKIEGETCQEIPICRLKKTYSGTSQEDYEIISPSDVRERQRKFMSEKDRAAHAHFPKEFVIVRVVGPVIPASITITGMPQKRKMLSEFYSDLRTKKKDETKEETKEETQEEAKEETSEEQPEEISEEEEEEEVKESEMEETLSKRGTKESSESEQDYAAVEKDESETKTEMGGSDDDIPMKRKVEMQEDGESETSMERKELEEEGVKQEFEEERVEGAEEEEEVKEELDERDSKSL